MRTHVATAPGEGELRLRSECAILFFPPAPLPLLSFLFLSLFFFFSFFFSLFLFSRGVWRFSRPVPFWDWFGAASTRGPFPSLGKGLQASCSLRFSFFFSFFLFFFCFLLLFLLLVFSRRKKKPPTSDMGCVLCSVSRIGLSRSGHLKRFEI